MNSVQALLAEGFPHSDIRGSTIARISPRLFAACHVLHRLLAPRHPPNALLMLSNSSNTARAQDQTAQDDRSPPPAWTVCSAGAGTTHASANFTHTSDKSSHPTAPSLEPPGRTIHPPDPIHRLKEHAHPRPKPQRETVREVRNLATGGTRFTWRLADSNR